MKDLMIDIETLSVKKNGAILSIGAVYFDRNTGKIGESFYARISKESALKHGVSDEDTLNWWEKQSEEARNEAFGGNLDSYDVAISLCEFIKPETKPWGNGSTTDITMLENWFDSVGVKYPWDFWNIRDVRTIVDWFNIDVKSFARDGVHHNALDDCLHQIKYMCEGVKK